ncbi:alpha/beta hydrolase [Chitinibacter bivalviorum]|uniref:Alpha/beta hydrolase n=2 Tax=Chitinibacter bivalviorum TaxID=2739434 RepID=A0A7H9BN27_9NEIS|nr:alpha/beta hydrolase [Chitinibacter bivalviorum]
MNLIEQWLKAGNRVLIAPGWNNSGPDHWQSHWQAQYPGVERIEQQDWLHPKAAEWVKTFEAKIAASEAPTIIVAHSLACATLAHWAALYGRNRQVKAALLVAPADVMRPEAPDEFQGFMPLPSIALPFPSWVIASSNDPSCSEDRATQLAQTWRSQLRIIADAGHINVESGHGEWPEGLQLLTRLLAQLYNLERELDFDLTLALEA